MIISILILFGNIEPIYIKITVKRFQCHLLLRLDINFLLIEKVAYFCKKPAPPNFEKNCTTETLLFFWKSSAQPFACVASQVPCHLELDRLGIDAAPWARRLDLAHHSDESPGSQRDRWVSNNLVLEIGIDERLAGLCARPLLRGRAQG